MGIPAEAIDRIFDPFYTSKEPGKGTGLGLSMVFGFLKQSHGHIEVESEVGHGTTLSVFLPATADAADEYELETSEDGNEPGGTETILSVEDNLGLGRVVAKQIKSLGYKLEEAVDAETALRVLEAKHVDLVFTDIVMPGGMSGIELAGIVAQRWPDTKVILTSGFPNAGKGNQRPLPGNVPLLNKPYRRGELARILRETLDSQKAG